MRQRKILVIDDELIMLKAAENLLKINNYRVDTALDPLEGLKMIENSPPDVILLDIRMPHMDGFEVCKKIKSNPNTKDIPVLIVSIQSDEADVVTGLELGADDYIVKPYRKRELIARVKTALRKKDLEPEAKLLSSGPLQLDLVTYKATLFAKPLPLNPKEFQLLALLMRREGQVLTRQVIAEQVWKTDHVPTSSTINSHMNFLRRKLGRYQSWIKSLKGIGYRFEVDD